MPTSTRKPSLPARKKSPSNKNNARIIPPPTDWRTTDVDEINRRIQRARDESHRTSNLTPQHPVFSTFGIASPSGMNYQVEIRDLATRHYSCTCTDFRVNGLGTCKHVEAVLIWLKRRHRGEVRLAMEKGSNRTDIVPAGETLKVERNSGNLPARLRSYFDVNGLLRPEFDPAQIIEKLKAAGESVRISQEVAPWLERRRRAEERLLLRRDYETGVREGRHPEQVTLSPLFPYQREGMMHLAFGERALLADEMGLGKTIQAIAACALLHHLGKARRALIVTPASLKTEWEEQIRKFTTLSQRLIFGSRHLRTRHYADSAPPFFTIVNYEQVVTDSLEINKHLQPDIVVLDEAQRIKNWATKTAQAVKRLDSRYAFVLTGTPIENRIDELRSIVDFLDPALLGPLFRFNREFYQFDEKGRPSEYQNLAILRERVRPVLLRRRKMEVETELPDRTDRNLFVPLTPTMRQEYKGYEHQVAELVQISTRRPLTPKEQDILMILLNIMRIICDSPGILKKNPSRECPKLDEIARILDECLADPDVKVIIFSEWEGMLSRVRDWAEKNETGYAWHTGSVPQKQRRGEIIAFREDPGCRLFLSTDSGGVGLNLQIASVVINCDLPWNPAKLEQRIARAWRKNQRRPVTVINLVAENTIEHSMLGTLAGKTHLAEGILDDSENLSKAKLKRGRDATLARLKQMLCEMPENAVVPVAKPAPGNPAEAFAARAIDSLGAALLHCDETFLPGSSSPVLLAVIADAARDRRPALEALHREIEWKGDTLPLHILDSSTWHAVQALAAAGLITVNTRASRSLTSTAAQTPPPPLSDAQCQRIATLRQTARKKSRVAKALLSEELFEEATPILRAAALAMIQANAIEARWPEPETLEETVNPPHARLWGANAGLLRDFINNPGGEVLLKLCESIAAG